MAGSHKSRSSFSSGATQFAATRWSTVLAARGDSTHSQNALEKLCRAYWYPLYSFVRRRGYAADDAQDLTQEFFVRLLARRNLRTVDRSKGRFRSFLLASLNHFLANEWNRAHAQKRGGGQAFVPIDQQWAESRYGLEPAHDETPERIFDRSWAIALLDLVLARLGEEHIAAGKGKLFELLKPTLAGDKSVAPYAELATTLGMTEGGVKVAVHRLRQRYREILRGEIAHTVVSAQDIEDEFRYLLAVLSQ